jgi:hypothetical protein
MVTAAKLSGQPRTESCVVASTALRSVDRKAVGRTLQRVHRAVERYWRRMLSSRSWKGTIWWKHFHQIKERTPLLRPKLYLPYAELQAIAVL